MIRINHINSRGMKMLIRRNVAEHRREHLERANLIRREAQSLKEKMEALAISALGGIDNETRKEIDAMYDHAMSEAIALENSKCVEGKH